ncbi:MAG: YafY family transcriptional regulator [Chloroflexia bacterium]|nr:YafY family transcriptional regulator [Chloroflexia bacterium]
MYHPTTRVLTVLELLQARGRLSGPELAERLEVDLRTVRRYVTMLQDLGIPVEAVRGRHGGYRLRPGFRLPPLVFSDDEALALTLGLLSARRLGLVTDPVTAEGALAKLERALPPDVRARVAAVQETLTIDQTQGAPIPTTAIVMTLAAAVHESRQVLLRYASAGGEETERVVEPYGLVHAVRRWYTPGFCHLRSGLRLFRLDRIRSVDLRAESFTPPAGFDPMAFVQDSLAVAPQAWHIEALLDTSFDQARQAVPPHEATIEPGDGGVTIRLNAECLDDAARYLIRIGCPFIVRRPEELRFVLRTLAAEIAHANAEPPHSVA